MSVSVLNNLGALNALAAVHSANTPTLTENGLFAALFQQQLGLENPLLSPLAPSTGEASLWLKNAFNTKANEKEKMDLAELFALTTAESEKVWGNVTPALEMISFLSSMKEGSGDSSPAGMLLSLLSQNGKNLSAQVAMESVKLAGEIETPTQAPFTSILNAIATDTAAQGKAPLTVQTPMGTSEWGTEFNQKIVWAAKNDWQGAQIQIHPENLGPIKIQMHLADGKAQIHFISAHSEVRQSIQEALPQLKEMLAASGISLGQANVGSEEKGGFSQEFHAQEHNQNGILEGNLGFEEIASALNVTPRVVKNTLSAVDLFA